MLITAARPPRSGNTARFGHVSLKPLSAMRRPPQGNVSDWVAFPLPSFFGAASRPPLGRCALEGQMSARARRIGHLPRPEKSAMCRPGLARHGAPREARTICFQEEKIGSASRPGPLAPSRFRIVRPHPSRASGDCVSDLGPICPTQPTSSGSPMVRVASMRPRNPFVESSAGLGRTWRRKLSAQFVDVVWDLHCRTGRAYSLRGALAHSCSAARQFPRRWSFRLCACGRCPATLRGA